ncbi:MAG: TatD family hydrolase, partial [Bdellovibrionales bacterium]
MSSKWTVDAHCHWSDSRVFAQAALEIQRMIDSGILGFQLGGIEPNEWKRQSLLADKFPGRVWRAFGLHPYFVARETVPALETAWTELLSHCAEIEAIGETGLDFRKQYIENGKDRQQEFFTRHLSLAKKHNKPLILHIVRAHEEALHELKDHSVQGMVHAFTAGPKVAKRYLDLGLHLSIGAKLLHPETHDLAETVVTTPLERLLIESDCPDQAPPGQSVHDSTTVWPIAERISELKKLPFLQVVE